MPNYAAELRIGRMRDSKEAIQYSFRFGKCDDFFRALDVIKRIPSEERDYVPYGNQWTVQASERNLKILCEAFQNFADMYAAAVYQLPLPLF